MTVIIGILCDDGVVIGADSAMAAGRAGRYTIEWQDGGALKIETHEPDMITAVTGAFGLGQRFNDQLLTTMRALKEPLLAPTLANGQQITTPVQQSLLGRSPLNKIPINSMSAVEIGRVISQTTINDFQRTQSTLQTGTPDGWGLGALFAFVHNDQPHLIDFDPARFHPELKGMPDPKRGDQDRIWRCVSMGAGQQLADAFLAHAYQLLFGKGRPTVDRAKLAVAWTIKHVKNYNLGLVGGETRLAILEKKNGKWVSHHEDPGQSLQQVKELEEYIAAFRRERAPEKAAEGALDLEKALAEKAEDLRPGKIAGDGNDFARGPIVEPKDFP